MNNVNTFDILLVDFGEDNIGSEQGGKRPAIVIQNDEGNFYSSTTIVMPLTTKVRSLYQPTHFLVKKSKGNGLKYDSTVLGECIRQISEQRIIKKLGKLDSVEDIKGAIRVFHANLGLMGVNI